MINPGVACVVPGDLEGVVTITIVPQPDCPILVDEGQTVVEGGTLTGNGCAGGAPCDVSDNDDNGGVALKAYVITQQGTSGVLTLDPSGIFTYVHSGNEMPAAPNNKDVIKYQTNNGQCNSNIATLTITITPTNDPPVGVADAYTVVEGGNINVDDPDGTGSPGDASDNLSLIHI